MPATLTILSLALYQWNNATNGSVQPFFFHSHDLHSTDLTVATGLMQTCGRVYSLTLLYTLLLRKKAARASYSGGARMQSTLQGAETLESRSWASQRPAHVADMRRWSPASDALSIIVHPPGAGDPPLEDVPLDPPQSYQLPHTVCTSASTLLNVYLCLNQFATGGLFTSRSPPESPESDSHQIVRFEQAKFVDAT